MSVTYALQVPAASIAVSLTVPLLQEKVYGVVPPVAVENADPVVSPLQRTLLITVEVIDRTTGSVIVTVSVSVQLFASVTVTV